MDMLEENSKNQTLYMRDDIEVLCENGIFRKCGGLLVTEKKQTVVLYFDDASYLECTPDHKIETPNGPKTAKELVVYQDTVYDENEQPKLLIKREKGSEKNVYDIINVEDTHKYVANNTKVQNCVVVDEFAFIPNNVAEEFLASTYPTISSGKSTKVIIISTPKGLNHFYRYWMDAINGKSEYVPVEAHWWEVPGRDENFKRQTIANTSETQWNSEFGCQFLGSDNTLISSEKLISMRHSAPVFDDGQGILVYEPPVKNGIYIVTVDTARGEGQDYSACSVFDVSSFPYTQVATYRSNTVSYQILPDQIRKLATLYNNAYVLIEVNDIGQSVADILHSQLEYDNIIKVTQKGNHGQIAGFGFGGNGKKPQLGLKSSVVTKKMGCQIIKDLIESDRIKLHDYSTIMEFSTFVADKASYAATEGYNDDMVMTTVFFAWLTTQPWFKDYTNFDLRVRLYEEKIRRIEESVPPFGFILDQDSNPDRMDGWSDAVIWDERNAEQRRWDKIDDWRI